MAFRLETDSAVGFGTATTMYLSAAVAKATLVDGYECVAIRLPKGMKRYIRVVYVVAVADLTAGKFTARLLPELQTNKANV